MTKGTDDFDDYWKELNDAQKLLVITASDFLSGGEMLPVDLLIEMNDAGIDIDFITSHFGL